MIAAAKRMVTENLGAKVLSVAIASLLWIAIVGEQELATAIDVPVEYRNFPKAYEVSSGMVNRVNLFVRGPSGKMNDTFLKDVAVVVDLEGVKRPGDWTFNLDNRAVRVPSGLQLERAIPTQIRMRFEERFARDVPVQIRYAGNPMPGYRIASQELSPEHLRVVGPRSHVEHLQSIDTDPIDLNGIISEFETRVSTFVDDPQLRIDGNSTVRVRLVMERIGPGLEQ
ncbi:MAG: YbbR-like domain-containing protein [Acidobacteria bacterium]|nr:YbbR-like domain-containing protein [Acidobacteriota bacterium]